MFQTKTPKRSRNARPGTVHLEGDLGQTSLAGRRLATVRAAEVLAEAMGNEVYIYDSEVYKNRDRIPNGFIDERGDIHIDISAGMDGENLGLFALAHESAHFMRDYDPVGFRAMADRVIELAEGNGVNMEAMIFRKVDVLEARGRLSGMNTEQKFDRAYEEVVADALEGILRDGKAVTELVSVNQTFFERLLARIKKIVDIIRRTYAKARPESEAGRMLADMAGAMDEVRELYVVALSTAGERRRAERSRMNSEKMHDTDSQTVREVRESVRPEYALELDQWAREGMPDGETFILGETGGILQGLGAVENDIYISGNKIKRILEEHPEMTMDEIKKVPQILDDPALILKSRNVGRYGLHNTRMAIFGTVKAKNGLPVMAILDLRPFDGGFTIYDMQKVDSAYTKDGDPMTFIKNSYIMYADAKKATPLLRSIGSQTPIKLNESGFIGSISYNQRSVNLFGKSFSDVFSMGEDTRYSDRPDAFEEALRRSGIGTDRYLLTGALESAIANEQEYRLLKEYKADLGRLDGLARELDEVKAEQKKLLFTKGKRDSEAIGRLEERKAQLTEEISRCDQQLLSLEATKPLRDILERERKNAKREIKRRDRIIERQGKAYRAMNDHHFEMRAKEMARYKAWRESDDRRRLRDSTEDILRRHVRLITKPTKNQNIPIELQPWASRLAEAIYTDTVHADERVARLRKNIEEERKKKNPNEESIEFWARSIDKIARQGSVSKHYFTHVAEVYEGIKNSTDPAVYANYDEELATRIREAGELVRKAGGLDRLSLEDARFVNDTAQMVNHTIIEGKRARLMAMNAKAGEVAEQSMEEMEKVGAKKEKRFGGRFSSERTPTAFDFFKGAYFTKNKPLPLNARVCQGG